MPDSTVARTLLAWGGLLAGAVALWVTSLRRRDASIVDIWWGPALAIAAAVYGTAAGWPPRARLVGALVAIWAARLALHIGRRHAAGGEDARYAAWRTQYGDRWWWRSLFQVFLLQASVAWVVSWPLAAASLRPGPPVPAPSDLAGMAVMLTGLACEWVADAQLRRFTADARHRGRVMDGGLWRYSRHPNYFGESLVWWGLWIVAAGAHGGWWTVVSPILMTYLLLRVSGVAMLERHMAHRPGYADYVRRTSAFVPWPPRA